MSIHGLLYYKGVGKGGGGGGGGGAGGAEAPPDFKLMLLCVQAVTAKEHPKCIIKNERKKTAFRL